VRDVIDATLVRRWCTAGLDALRNAREEIDALNVYPVPDGDTGTNLVLTMQAVAESLPADELADLEATMTAVARGALMGARGNSGVILSQILRGLSEVFCDLPRVSGTELQRALRRAADLGYAAVAEPVEGTVLTVARAAADAAERCPTADLAAVATAAAAGAAEALARTPEQLEALARAGVVDAGGRGLVVLLESLALVVSGESVAVGPAPAVVRTALEGVREGGSSAYGYEVQYLLDADERAVDALRERLSGLGDSLLVAGGDELWNVHVHVNDVGAAIEAGVEAGRPHRIQVTRFADQIAARPAGDRREPCLIVTTVTGAGLRRLFEEEGAVVVGSPAARPSTQEIVEAIESCTGDRGVVLPNDPDIHAVAAAAADLTRGEGRLVAVVPTRSPVQGLAALAVHDPERPFGDDVIAMTAAAGATRYGALTLAAREAQTTVGVCRAGDVLGLAGDDVTLIGTDLFDVAVGLLDRMLIGGGELVTLVVGSGAPAGLGDRVVDYLSAVRPTVEVVVYDGGQPHYPLLLGVE
jgi:DAK2 domain fusion protein YloV